MIGFISTSLKVVSMAVSFFTATNLFETVLRNEVIFSLRSFLDLVSLLVVFSCAFIASDLVMRPPMPVPLTSLESMPFSANILAAAGEG